MVTLGLQGLAVAVAYGGTRALVFPWYVPLMVFPITLAGVALAVDSAAAGRRAAAISLGILALLAALPQARVGLGETTACLRDRPADSEHVSENARVVAYAELGTRLALMCPHATVMAPEIGALGWTFPGKIVDAVGLVSPEVLPFHPLAVPQQRRNHHIGGIPFAAVAAFQPDVIVTMSTFTADLAANGPALAALGYQVRLSVPVHNAELRALGLSGNVFGSDRIGVLATAACPVQ